MKLLATISASAIVLAGFASAATQQTVLGESGIPAWPLNVQTTEGQQLVCKREIYVRNGENRRDCRPERGLLDSGDGVTAAAGAAGAIVALALIVGGSSSSTTTTTTD